MTDHIQKKAISPSQQAHTNSISSFLVRYEFIIPLSLFLVFLGVTLLGISWGAPNVWHPDEIVVRSIKEVGWTGFSVNDALTPLANMGQQLFEPPDVAGWELGPGWFSSGAMLARMNFASQLAMNQKFNLRDLSRGHERAADENLPALHPRIGFPASRHNWRSRPGHRASP